MSPQADYVVSNGTGAAVRSDINGQLAAIVSNNSGASAPATTYAYMLWADTSTNLLKLRNGANSAWITVGDLTAANLGLATLASPTFTGTATIPTLTVSTAANIPLGSAASPTLYFTGDSNTGLYSPGADQVALSTGGTGRLFIDSSGRCGIGTSSPSAQLDVAYGDYITAGAIRIGADLGTNTSRTNNTRKYGAITAPHYDNTKANVVGIAIDSQSNSSTLVSIGGGSSSFSSPSQIQFLTSSAGITAAATTAMTIDSSQRVGIGTTSPDALLCFAGATGKKVNFYQGSDYSIGVEASQLRIAAVYNTVIYRGGYSGSETARFDLDGRLLVGTSSYYPDFFGGTSGYNGLFQVAQNAWNATAQFHNWTSDANLNSNGGTQIFISRSKSGTVGTHTALADGNDIGSLVFNASDGTNFRTAALIKAACDGGVSTGDVPGRLVFSTTADGASSPTERMRITQQGELFVGVQNPTGNSYAFVKTDSNTCYIADRINSDGDLFIFRQAGTQEGSISVSGTTVSYNGAHLSRWSQLPSGAEREEILRGTVLSNIDEMCEWGDEENEQLNRMKVSDVEGDKNVSGVFQCWDDDDDTYTNDFYCAMTGDFIIRIAQGVTVARGDLLMSAGDGTAKPQDDDIIRSKTIAKVTSTNVSCTYDDGSYCVPCVLMAC